METKLTPSKECYSCIHKRNVPGDAHIACAKPDLGVRGNPHGINHGWFFYPVNFDPIWKETNCKNFENKSNEA